MENLADISELKFRKMRKKVKMNFPFVISVSMGEIENLEWWNLRFRNIGRSIQHKGHLIIMQKFPNNSG